MCFTRELFYISFPKLRSLSKLLKFVFLGRGQKYGIRPTMESLFHNELKKKKQIQEKIVFWIPAGHYIMRDWLRSFLKTKRHSHKWNVLFVHQTPCKQLGYTPSQYFVSTETKGNHYLRQLHFSIARFDTYDCSSNTCTRQCVGIFCIQRDIIA